MNVFWLVASVTTMSGKCQEYIHVTVFGGRPQGELCDLLQFSANIPRIVSFLYLSDAHNY